MTDRERVMKALKCRVTDPVVECGNCPYNDAPDDWRQRCDFHRLCADALALLKEQEPRVIELSEISPNIYVWVEDRDDGTLFPLKGGVIDPDEDDYFRFDADFGNDFVYYPTGSFGKCWRVWDKCPSPEQMRDTKWEGDSDAE